MPLFWSILFLIVLLFLSNFIKNYLKTLKIENDNNDPNLFWKFTYDHYDKNEFNKTIINVKDSYLVRRQKKFKDNLIILFWILIIFIFITILYIFSDLVLRMIF